MPFYLKTRKTAIKQLIIYNFVLLALLGLFSNESPDKTLAQSPAWPPLPAPIIFSDTEGNLIYIDHHTQTTRILYTNPDPITIRALGWSPQRDLLLFFREDLNAAGQIIPQLCLLNRQGVLQRCFADHVVNYGTPAVYDQIATATWSESGRYIYFMADGKADQRMRFVEAEVATGATSRVLYEVPEGSSSRFLAISKDLRYLLANVGDDTTFGTPYLVDLATKEEIPLDSLASVESGRFFCLGFSPNSQYLVIRNSADGDKPVMQIVTLQGEVVHTILGPDPESEGLFLMTCPTWQADSNSLYFSALNIRDQERILRVFRYDLTQQQTTIVYQFPDNDDAWLGPSKLDNLLMGTEAFVYETRLMDSVFFMLNGQVYRLKLPYGDVSLPIWSIDLSVPLATPTPTPTPTPTITPTVPANFIPLMLYSACSENPLQTRRWGIVNANQFPLAYTWRLENSDQQGEGVAYPYGLHFWETTTIGDPNDEESNVMSIYVGGVLQSSRMSDGGVCGGGWQ
jgi:hypothetical protein